VIIPKQKATEAISEDGVRYIKVEDIRFPLITYIINLPIRLFRITLFELRIRGFLKIPINKANETKPDYKIENTCPEIMKVEQLKFGQPIENTIGANVTNNGNQIFGQCSVKFESIDEDLAFGNDVLKFNWESSEGEKIEVYHIPDFFLRLMFSKKSEISGKFISEATDEELDAFNKRLLIHKAKSIIDDRTYENIQISGHSFEVQLKYIGLHVYLAAIQDDSNNIFALLSGVRDKDDFLEPFIVKISLSEILDSSTASYDAEEKLWVQI